MKNTWKKAFPDFNPDFTPVEIFKMGAFGGAYFDAYVDPNWQMWVPSVFVDAFTEEEMTTHLTKASADKKINKYGVHCGSSYKDWLTAGWIRPEDPFGWMNWYINFYYGRRSDDDQRQIKRWKAFIPRHAGILKAYPNSRKTKQNMLHWAVDYKKI